LPAAACLLCSHFALGLQSASLISRTYFLVFQEFQSWGVRLQKRRPSRGPQRGSAM